MQLGKSRMIRNELGGARVCDHFPLSLATALLFQQDVT